MARQVRFIHVHRFDEALFAGFEGSEVVVTDQLVLFWKPPSPFGQWTDSPFTLDGRTYRCAEQYMMAEKARLFGDEQVERAILDSDSPREHKRLGRQIAGFDETRWAEQRCEIVFRGNVAKFTQHPELGKVLLETSERTLVEASPLDKIWGIGLAANDPDAYEPDKWPGQNLLGKTLERVRARLRETR